MAELENRQAATAADSSPQMAARTAQIRNILAWHLHKVQTQSIPMYPTRTCQSS